MLQLQWVWIARWALCQLVVLGAAIAVGVDRPLAVLGWDDAHGRGIELV